MLRLYEQTRPEIVSGVHYKKHAQPANTLHCVGEKLPSTVSTQLILMKRSISTDLTSELFGTSEDESELDETEDAENGKPCFTFLFGVYANSGL